MKKKTFTETQVLAAIQKQEKGLPLKEVCSEMDIQTQTFLVVRPNTVACRPAISKSFFFNTAGLKATTSKNDVRVKI